MADASSLFNKKRRRQSVAHGLTTNRQLGAPISSSKERRKTISVAPHDKENGGTLNHSLMIENSSSDAKENGQEVATKVQQKGHLPSTTPSKSPFHRHRTRLSGSASAFYFKGIQKTPGKQSANNKSFNNASFDALSPYDGSVGAAETSFLSAASTNSSSTGTGSEGDMLNHSVLSDTTELAPSSFVFSISSRQRFKHEHNKWETFKKDQEDLHKKLPPNDREDNNSVPIPAARPPLSLIKSSHDSGRRHTIDQQTALDNSRQQNQDQPGATPSEGHLRRESWHGPSPPQGTGNGQFASDRAKQFLSKMNEMRQQREKRYPRLSNSSVGSNSSALSAMQASLRELGSPVLENNRVVKRKKTPSMPSGEESVLDTSFGSRLDQAQDTNVAHPQDRRETADTTDLDFLSSGSRSSNKKDSRRETADTSDLGFLSSAHLRAEDDETAEISDFDLRSPELSAKSTSARHPLVEISQANGKIGETCDRTGESGFDSTMKPVLPLVDKAAEKSSESDTSSILDLLAPEEKPALSLGCTLEVRSDLEDMESNTEAKTSPKETGCLLDETADESDFDFLSLSADDKDGANREDKSSKTDEPQLGTSSMKSENLRIAGSNDVDLVDSVTNSGPEDNSKQHENESTDTASIGGAAIVDRSESSVRLDDTANESDFDLLNESLSGKRTSEGSNQESPEPQVFTQPSSSSDEASISPQGQTGDINVSPVSRSSGHSSKAVGLSSPSSRLDTPGSNLHEPRSPLPLPSEVGFEIQLSPLLAQNSGIRMTPTSRQKPTPTKLSHRSPRRVVNPKATDSPARNTRSKSKSPQKKRDDEDLESPVNSSVDSGMHDSSFEEIAHFQRGPGTSQYLNTSSSSILLNSSFRKTGSVRRDHGARKSVAFGSPEILQYNISSPPMSATPMPSNNKRSQTLMPDDTVEIERDMKTLLESVGNPSIALRGVKTSHDAGSTPFSESASSKIAELKLRPESAKSPSQESDMSMDSESEDIPVNTEDETVGLEDNMALLLAQSLVPEPGKGSRTIVSTNLPQEETIGLEDNMAVLFAQAGVPDESKKGTEDKGSGSKRKWVPTRNTEDENTVELECNMADLLNTANCGNGSVEEGCGELTEDLNVSKRRRSSISARRFSIGPNRRISINSETRSMAQTPPESPATNFKDEGSEVDGEKSQICSTSEYEANRIALKVGDVLELIEKNESPSDIIGMFHECFSSCCNTEIFDGLEAFVEEVCTQLENETVPSVDPDTFQNVKDENQEGILRLQNFMRSNSPQKKQSAVRNLTSVIETSERKKWDVWLFRAAEHLLRHATTVEKTLSQQKREIKNLIESVERDEKKLFQLEAKKVRRARRQSLGRRKVNASSLKEELQNIKDEISKVQSKLDESKGRREKIQNKDAQKEKKISLSRRVPRARDEAQASESKWRTIKNVSVWQLSDIRTSRTSISYSGFCPEANATADLELDSEGELVCRVEPGSSSGLRSYQVGRLLPKTISAYVASRNMFICSSMENMKRKSANAIKSNLRSQAAKRCRLEVICSELSMLHRRYSISLEPESVVSVMFTQTGSTLELWCRFELNDSYPFGSLNTRIEQSRIQKEHTPDEQEDQVDLDALQMVLSKNAKPGFGYLSRTIGVISAFFQNWTKGRQVES